MSGWAEVGGGGGGGKAGICSLSVAWPSRFTGQYGRARGGGGHMIQEHRRHRDRTSRRHFLHLSFFSEPSGLLSCSLAAEQAAR